MLKINKILSKKIKSPLSLRGAKRRSNLNGFSLIELMVAVAILAMAIFGIFHAYSSGFMGMADARDRTVATNYAREAMEDIKNMDFDKIEEKVGTTTIPGTKFTKVVIVQPSINLKKISTQVYWKDRKGNTKMVETNILIHFIQTTAGTAKKIILYANHYNVLTEDNTDTTDDERESFITAVIKDDKGNTVTTPEYDISFSITQISESASGGLYPSNKTTINGKATTTFASSGGEGEVTITASVTVLTSDSIIIKITDPQQPVKINLAADPIFMTATTSSTSEITATIVNAGGATVESATNEITFSVSGPGTLTAPTTLPPVIGIATITLTSSGTPGTITVTASASGLEPGVVDVITGGQISLSASLEKVPVNEKSVITVTTKDVNGVPINYVGTINLSVESTGGLGTLFPGSITFKGDNSSETVIFTASSEGTVNITAIDSDTILTGSDILTLTVTKELVPHHIEVSAYPSSIEAGGTDTSTIIARVKTEDNITITSYTDTIVFTTTEGEFYNGDTTISTGDTGVTYKDGVATVEELYPADTSGTAEIKVYSPSIVSPSITGGTEVEFYTEADHIKLVAAPQNIQVGNVKFLVVATMVDENNAKISNYNESVTFDIFRGFPNIIKYQTSNTPGLTTAFSAGEVIIDMKSVNEAGTATINAESGVFSGSLNIPVGITLSLVEYSINYISTPIPPIENSVSFDIMIVGAPLKLEEMRVSWEVGDPVETLDKIEIKTPSTADPAVIVFDDSINPASSGKLINFEEITLSEGTSNVKMYFNADMFGKNILDVTFNPNSGDYTVHLVP